MQTGSREPIVVSINTLSIYRQKKTPAAMPYIKQFTRRKVVIIRLLNMQIKVIVQFRQLLLNLLF